MSDRAITLNNWIIKARSRPQDRLYASPRPPDNRFGELLERYRQSRDLSMNTLGTAVGCAAGHISRLERGQRRPSLAIVSALITALELSPPQASRLQIAAGYVPPQWRVRLLEAAG